MAFPATALDITVEAALGADLTAASATWVWTDITSYALRPISIGRGGADEFSTFSAGELALMFNNSDGRFTINNPTGAYYGTWRLGTPIRVSVNPSGSDVVRITGFVTEVSHEWVGVREQILVTTVVADGVLRRIGQGRPLRSALYRALNPDANGIRPVEYWPMEDGSGSQLISSAVTGGSQFAIQGTVNLASSTDFPGSAALPVLDAGAFFGTAVRPYTSPATNQWAVRWAMWLPSTPSSACTLFQVNTTGTVVRWRFTLTPASPDTVLLTGLNSAGTEVLGASSSNFVNSRSAEAYAEPVWVEFNAAQNGGNIDWDYTIWTALAGQTKSGSVAGTLGNVTGIAYGSGGALADAVIGHIAVAADVDYGLLGMSGALAKASENADDRWLRLLATRVDVESSAGTPTVDTALGTEQTSDLLSALRLVMESDQGMGVELADGTVHYISRSELYNRAVALTLDYDSKQLAIPWIPTEDDQLTRNDWTVSNVDGGSARYRAPEVDPDSANYDETAPVYDDEATVNLYQDDALAFHAQWRVHLGTLGTQRYPQVSIDLARSSTLITDWLACDIGSKIRITNPPSQLAPDPIDLLIVGYSETIDQKGWRADLNCVTARPYDVFKVGDSSLGRLDSGGSTLAAGVNTVATSLSVATATGHVLWGTNTPFDIDVAGERMTVTAVSGASSPQTFTVTRSVNGVVKSQSSGAAIHVWRGGFTAL